MLTLFAHIQDIIHIIFSVCTYSKNFITGKEGDLPVGFPDRFNSSVTFIFLRVKGGICELVVKMPSVICLQMD